MYVESLQIFGSQSYYITRVQDTALLCGECAQFMTFSHCLAITVSTGSWLALLATSDQYMHATYMSVSWIMINQALENFFDGWVCQAQCHSL